MKKQEIISTIKKLKENSSKRKFDQTYDLNIVFQNLDMKKDGNKVDLFVTLPNSKGKKPKICALVGAELAAPAKKLFTTVIEKDDFAKYAKDKKLTKKLANDHDFFIAQANIMANIAQAFGRVFGPRGKMPNPKAGCVVPPTADLTDMPGKLENLVLLKTKGKELGVKCAVGNESMKDEEVSANILSIYDVLIKNLPQGKDNIKKAYLKLTMSKSFLIGEKDEKA